MQMSLGQGVFQWEHKRSWQLGAGASEFCRAEGALIVPGFSSLSVFFRRESQSAVGPIELHIWTAPIYFRPLDEDFSANPKAWLYHLAMAPAVISTGPGASTNAEVFGGQIAAGQPMGSLLFWEVKNAHSAALTIVGDIYVVPNHTGSMVLGRIGRAVDGPTVQYPSIVKGK